MNLYLDLTSWVKSPSRSLGLCARRLDETLRRILTRESGVNVCSVSRVSKKIFPETNASIEDFSTLQRIEEWFWFERFIGARGVYHALDTVLPPLKKSFRVATVHDCWDLQENPYSDPCFWF
jgi:hypothetical protein